MRNTKTEAGQQAFFGDHLIRAKKTPPHDYVFYLPKHQSETDPPKEVQLVRDKINIEESLSVLLGNAKQKSQTHVLVCGREMRIG